MAINLNGFDPDAVGPFGDRPVALPDEDDQCNGICLSGADIGVPEYGGIAYAHPDCPEHGDAEPDHRDSKYDAYPMDDPEDV